MEFVDRVSAYPNRYMLTDENGITSYVILEKADDPVVVGTPLNAENMNNLIQNPQTISDMNTMTSLFGIVNADTQNTPNQNTGFALNRTFGSYQLQYIFMLADPGVIASRVKVDGVWRNWSQIKFGYASATTEE